MRSTRAAFKLFEVRRVIREPMGRLGQFRLYRRDGLLAPLDLTMPSIADLRLNDLPFDAANRLLQKGHAPHIVARATGMHINKVHSPRIRGCALLPR